MNNKRILLIEEQPDIANLLWAYLSELGYEVQIAKSQEEAITLLYRSLPFLIIVSSAVPLKDYSDEPFGKRLRQIRLIDHILILFITPEMIYDEIEGRTKENHYMMEDYMMKPFDTEELRIRIKNSIDRSDLYREINFFDGLATRKR